MKILKIILFSLALLHLPSTWAEGVQSVQSELDAKATQLINDGTRLVREKKAAEALAESEQVIALYEGKFNDPNIRYYSARFSTESLMYLMEAANKKAGSALVESSNWAYGYFLKAYALQDMGRIDEAKSALQSALALSPQNSQFHSELGNIYEREKNWPMAMKEFQEAEESATGFSPPEQKNLDLSRAWRGLGFVYVEQNRLDDAEKMYRQCLDIDKNDTKAMNELHYVQNLRAKQGSAGSLAVPVNATGSTQSNSQSAIDPVKLYEAYFATFFAATACRGPDDPKLDVTNLVLAGNVAGNETARLNPGMQPADVRKMLDDRLAKVKATVDGQIQRGGCDQPGIKSLVENFKKISARPMRQAGAAPGIQ
ncbi:MAG: tetratricopeptide repeat protein [Collimonas sp.]|uniref:tetratricopeptide repeat protein n=1 Tax=Collimonas sp. TaxID=1963772 RepID=UPI0032677EA7